MTENDAADEALKGFSNAEMGALAHLYRGEVYRSTLWRTRLDQTTKFRTGAPYTWAVVEHKHVFGLTVKAELGNLLGRSENFTRAAYGTLLGQPGDLDPPFIRGRRNGPLGYVEDRSRERLAGSGPATHTGARGRAGHRLSRR